MPTGYAILAILHQYLVSLHVVNRVTAKCYIQLRRTVESLVSLIAGSNKRRRLSTGETDNKVFMTRSLRSYAEDNRTEFNCMQW